MASTEHLTVGGSSMEVYVDAPKAKGPHPGVVVTHHRGALDAFTKKFVEDLAAAFGNAAVGATRAVTDAGCRWSPGSAIAIAPPPGARGGQ